MASYSFGMNTVLDSTDSTDSTWRLMNPRKKIQHGAWMNILSIYSVFNMAAIFIRDSWYSVAMLNVGATYSIEMNTAAMLNKVEYRFMNPRDVSTLSFERLPNYVPVYLYLIAFLVTRAFIGIPIYFYLNK